MLSSTIIQVWVLIFNGIPMSYLTEQRCIEHRAELIQTEHLTLPACEHRWKQMWIRRVKKLHRKVI